MVRLAGIEPTTPWFVAKYSIQLSYSRENKIIAPIQQRLEAPSVHNSEQIDMSKKKRLLHEKHAHVQRDAILNLLTL